MKHFLRGIFTFSLFCLLSGCDIINPKESQPAYISIDTIPLTTDPVLQGSNSARITDAWIYIDKNLIGAFELPCRIPVLEEGDHEILVGAGIQVNGISALRSAYSFYKFWEGQVNLSPGETANVSPTVAYFDSLNFPLIANFDDQSGNKIEASIASDTIVSLTSSPNLVFEGNGSFLTSLRRDSGYVEFQTVDAFVLPKQGANVYAELNYKTSHELSIGIAAYYPVSATRRSLIINLNPSDTWNKVYLNLTEAVSTEVNATNYRLFFFSFKPAGTPEMEILIDNLKIIH
ncbi:MAG: hypothetical protein WED33_01675 [Bacteroidia bacterium]